MFGKNLRIIMAYRDKTSIELSKESGVSAVNLSFILTGRTKEPRRPTAVSLAKALNVEVEDFYRTDLVNL